MVDRRLRIALVIESSREYGRGLLRGIGQHAKAHGPWVLQIEERSFGQAVPGWLSDWRGDGIIARVENPAFERALRATGVPCIDVRGAQEVNMPVFDTDNVAVARLAAEHLVERGYREFAFCGYDGLDYSQRRLASFREVVGSYGREVSVFESPAWDGAGLRDIEQQGFSFEETLADWLDSLPRPVGLFACNDIRAHQVVNTCRQVGVLVPEQVGVIGVDDDEILCQLSDPTLSSVAPDTVRIGREAAALMERMIREGYRSTERMIVPPRGIVARATTGSPVVGDAAIARALWYIREHASEPLTVDEVADFVSLRRRTLERRFRDFVGRSPNEEIIRARISRVQELLRTTDWPLSSVAERCGFEHAEYMSVLFKKKTGEPPGTYRQRMLNSP